MPDKVHQIPELTEVIGHVCIFQSLQLEGLYVEVKKTELTNKTERRDKKQTHTYIEI